MTEPTVVRSVRMPAAHWAFVAQRAKTLGINPNAWMTRMVRKQMDGKEVAPNDVTRKTPPETRPARSEPAPAAQIKSRLKGEWKAP